VITGFGRSWALSRENESTPEYLLWILLVGRLLITDHQNYNCEEFAMLHMDIR
jgi:hypothetical protein